MLRKLAISVLTVFCIYTEITLSADFYSLSKREITVLSSYKIASTNKDIIVAKELDIVYGPHKIFEKIVETSDTTEINEEKTENEVAKEIKSLEESNEQSIKEEIKTTKKENVQKEYINKENVIKKQNSQKNTKKVVKEAKNQTPVNPANRLIIGSNTINITITNASQHNIDIYDIVQDNKYFSSEDNIIILGHDYNSFRCLKNVVVGQKIELYNNGSKKEYIVYRSDKAFDNKEQTMIFAESDGEEVFYNQNGYNNTLKLVTCEASGRRVISAYMV